MPLAQIMENHKTTITMDVDVRLQQNKDDDPEVQRKTLDDPHQVMFIIVMIREILCQPHDQNQLRKFRRLQGDWPDTEPACGTKCRSTENTQRNQQQDDSDIQNVCQ